MLHSKRGSALRAVGYHRLPPGCEKAFRRQLEYFARRYESLDEAGLGAFFAGEKSAGGRPLVISFDDGFREQYEVAAPLLEEYGLRGWFFVPTGFVDLGAEEQRDFCLAHEILPPDPSLGRPMMNRSELVDLGRRGHVVGCHTASHHRFRGNPDRRLIEEQILGARLVLDSILGRPTRSFAWVGGEPDTYAPAAFAALAPAGIDFAFTTLSRKSAPCFDPLMIHRTVLEPDMPFVLFKAKLLFVSDLVHALDRIRIERSLRS